jgi:hypothetical protein
MALRVGDDDDDDLELVLADYLGSFASDARREARSPPDIYSAHASKNSRFWSLRRQTPFRSVR